MNLMNNLLTVNNLSKTYYSKKGETLAIENVSFSINKNDFIGIVGPSGCGKSTFLRTLNRMNDLIDDVKITGEVLIDGEEKDSVIVANVENNENSIFKGKLYAGIDREFSVKTKIDVNLSNVQKIVHKYENSMLVKYSVQNGWFVFSLIVLPDCDGEK